MKRGNTPPIHVRPAAPRRRGLTLVELMLGLIVTVIIGGAVASMLFAVTRASDEQRDLRALVAKDKRVQHATTAAIRTGRTILDAEATRLVLWYRDDNEDLAIDAGELRVLDYDAGADVLRWYEPNDTMPPTVYTGGEDFAEVAAALIADGRFDAESWATQVTAAAFAIDTADPAAATLVSYRLALRQGVHDHAAIAAISRRKH